MEERDPLVDLVVTFIPFVGPHIGGIFVFLYSVVLGFALWLTVLWRYDPIANLVVINVVDVAWPGRVLPDLVAVHLDLRTSQLSVADIVFVLNCVSSWARCPLARLLLKFEDFVNETVPFTLEESLEVLVFLNPSLRS